jgi:hypothetical protein
MKASRHSNKPSVHVFMKTEKPLITLDHPDLNERKHQKEALEDWWERTFCDANGHNVGGFNDFSSVQESLKAGCANGATSQTSRFGITVRIPGLAPIIMSLSPSSSAARTPSITPAMLLERPASGMAGSPRCSSLGPAAPASRRSCARACCRSWNRRARSLELTPGAAY